MYVLTRDNQVMFENDAGQAITRIFKGSRGWALNISPTGVPSVGGEVTINAGEAVAEIIMHDLLDSNGDVLGSGQVKRNAPTSDT